MIEIIGLITLTSFFIVIIDYFKEINKTIFYFACWISIAACLFDGSTRGFTNPVNLLFAFLIFMAFRQRKKKESKFLVEQPHCKRCANQ